jgi:hypothetical protein
LVRENQSAAGGSAIGARTCIGVLSSIAALINISGNQNSIGMALSLQSVQAAPLGKTERHPSIGFLLPILQAFARKRDLVRYVLVDKSTYVPDTTA